MSGWYRIGRRTEAKQEAQSLNTAYHLLSLERSSVQSGFSGKYINLPTSE